MFGNGSLLGPLLNGLLGGLVGSGRPVNEPGATGQTGAENNADNSVAEVEAPDSGGVKFDLSQPGGGAAGNAGDAGDAADTAATAEEDALAAYFYAAKWAQSIRAQMATPAETRETIKTDDGFIFASEPFRRDIVEDLFSEQTIHFMGRKLATIGANGVLTMADSANQGIQPSISLGKF
ncbi:hypothetical protein SAMN04487972_104209 [Paracoccus halophilus]|uniref:Uncharacterized protein n=1 Tax=Paracoccus halophilus TaxID=376733 RepID=A0A099F5T8_9RHOB|nr:hypothetical protein [Paracoccus halophilus]KGJ06090.1 hypothetical protein IT41_02705 [Paracoccus halophilus]SFA46346.1 hypothetical protein SAMN04487972_104209 [Paracoccus halophilus]